MDTDFIIYDESESELYSMFQKTNQTYEQNRLNENLLQIENRYRDLQQVVQAGNWELDIEKRMVWASEEAFCIYGIHHHSSYLTLQEVQKMVHKDDRTNLNYSLEQLIKFNIQYDIEFRIIREDNQEERIIHSVAKLEIDNNGKPRKVHGVIHDVTERKVNEDLVNQYICYDILTQLPNKVHFIESLHEAIEKAKGINSRLAIVVIDIDHLKKINDVFGLLSGDELIRKVGERIQSRLNPPVFLARLDGDEFAFYIPYLDMIDRVHKLINDIMDAFDSPFMINGNSIHVSCSFGISLFPNDHTNGLELLKNAEIAVFKAKTLSSGNYQFYSPKISEELLRRLNIDRCLKDAIVNQELEVHYQPQFDARTGKIRGVEALLRFNSKELGMVSPVEFIPIAEENKLIVSIGEWVLRTACNDCMEWTNKYGNEFIVSVNISAVQLGQRNFIDIIKNILQETGMKTELLELEITESVLINSFDKAKNIFEKLKEIGIKIAVDDFGTGYSSLNYISKLPFHTLKIDKVFVQDIKKGSREELITSVIIDFAHALGFEVVAEGVETKEQLDFLVSSECDHLQGFLFSRPIVKSSFLKMINDKSK